MAVRLGTNISALKAQRRLGEATEAYSRSINRLASGQRINRPSDDAAGLAVAESLNLRSRVSTRAVQNANDGISLLNIADGALGELSGIVQRIAELAEQASTGGYSVQQRKALNTEAQSLRDEFQRVTLSTQFNGLGILRGDIQGLRLQLGFGVDGSISGSVGGKLGSGSFTQASTNGPSRSESITSTDLNGDGAIDLISVGVSGGGPISVTLGNGQGSFGTAVSYASGSALYGVAAADFNGDGWMDVAASGDAGNIFLRLGNGTGALGALTTISVTGTLGELTAADFNGDGKIDLAAGDSADEFVRVLLGDGAGGFSAPTSYTAGAVAQSIATADFNGDGRLDIVSANRDDPSISVFLGNGTGGFTSVGDRALQFSGPTSITAGDFNGDGRPDVAVASSARVEILAGAGDGTFNALAEVTFAAGGSGVVRSADLNGDGLLDLAVGGSIGDLSFVLGNGAGGFTTSQTTTQATQIDGVTLNDFNNDGVFDIATTGNPAASSFIYTGVARDGTNPLLTFSLETMADARQALAPLSRKIEAIATQRGVLGGLQSRLASAVQTSLSERDLSTSAIARIRDADVAVESANLVASSIRREASAAILAQANQQPALALLLLRR